MRGLLWALLLWSAWVMAAPPDDGERLRVLRAAYPDYRADRVAIVDVSDQELRLYVDGRLAARYPVSTAEAGTGSAAGSNRTPLGAHYVRRRYGAGAPAGMVFRARVPTGRIAAIEHRPRHIGEDLVTSRILWLAGLEPGRNQGPGVDSFRRYIYIHGTPEEGLIGRPASHGCIRLRNEDVIALFDALPVRSLVWIQP